jgi:hypothetical protein
MSLYFFTDKVNFLNAYQRDSFSKLKKNHGAQAL